MLICTVQSFISDINILGVECDKVVDFPKSGHNHLINSKKNVYSMDIISGWNQFANLLYIDQPGGTGFSYVTNPVSCRVLIT